MIYHNLGSDIIAFTTDRTAGRDKSLILQQLAVEHPDVIGETSAISFYYPHQTHTANVINITPQFFQLSQEEQKQRGEGIDALISNAPLACLGISTADCIPVLIYDAEHHCAAAIHAGWKGTLQRIVEKAIQQMTETYATRPEQCTAAIGPGISWDSFEVGMEVVEAFTNAGFQMSSVTKMMPARDGNGERPHIDLKEINRQQLISQGIKASSITVSPIDTFTNTAFFSARREQKGDIKCGRILSGFVLLHK